MKSIKLNILALSIIASSAALAQIPATSTAPGSTTRPVAPATTQPGTIPNQPANSTNPSTVPATQSTAPIGTYPQRVPATTQPGTTLPATTINPGTVPAGTTTPGTTVPGSITQPGTLPGAVTPNNVPGTVTPGTTIPGTTTYPQTTPGTPGTTVPGTSTRPSGVCPELLPDLATRRLLLPHQFVREETKRILIPSSNAL